MNTEEFRNKLSLDIAKLELKEKLDPRKRNAIRRRKKTKAEILKQIEQRCDRVTEHTTIDV